MNKKKLTTFAFLVDNEVENIVLCVNKKNVGTFTFLIDNEVRKIHIRQPLLFSLMIDFLPSERNILLFLEHISSRTFF